MARRVRLESDAGANAWAVAAEKGYGYCAEGSDEGRGEGFV